MFLILQILTISLLVASTFASDKSPTAVEVGKLLKANGIRFVHEIKDGTGAFDFIKGRPDVGIVSKATTWTNAATFDITTFRTVDFRRQARTRMDATDKRLQGTPLASPLYAECGLILIYLQPDSKNSENLAKDETAKAQEIMKKHYKCK